MIALVTGGTGFIGSHLVERLLADGHEVHALVRNPARLRWLEGKRGVRLLSGDLGSLPPMPRGVDRIFHLAGLTKAARSTDYYIVNRDGAANLLRAAEASGGRPAFIHLSSLAAGGPSHRDGRARREDDPPAPVSAYGESKAAGEREVLRFRERLPVVLLRVAAVFGPRDEDFLEYFRIVARGLVPCVGLRRVRPVSLIYVRDVVRAMIRAAEVPLPSGEIFNVAAAPPSTWEEMGERAARILGRRPLVVRVPVPAAFAAAACSEAWSRLTRTLSPLNLSKFQDMRQPGWIVDVVKAERLLGFRAETPLEDGLRETLEWYRKEGWL